VHVVLFARRCLLVLVVWVAALVSVTAQDIPNPFPAREVSGFTLANGLHVVVREDHSLPVVSMVVVVRGGSSCEMNTRGAAHYLEHLVFQGTKKYPTPLAPQTTLESKGGLCSAVTTRDMTRFQATISTDQTELLIDVLTDLTQTATLDDTRFAWERPTILAEIQRDIDNPLTTGINLANYFTYLAHPYRHPVAGTPDEVLALSVTDIRTFYRRWYVPKNMSVVFVGDITPRKALLLLNKAFAQARTTSPPALPAVDAYPPKTLARLHIPRDIPSTYQVMAYPAPGGSDVTRVVANDLLMTLLGDTDEALLGKWWAQQGITVDRYGIEYVTSRAPGRFLIWAQSSPKMAVRVREATQSLLTKLYSGQIPPEAFALAKQRLAAQFLIDNETYSQQASTLAYFEGISTAAQATLYVPLARAVTVEQVRPAVPHQLLGWITIGAAPEGE